MEYQFRNLPFSRRNCWKVIGKFPNQTKPAVLEWCPSKKDAEFIMDKISSSEEFTELSVSKEDLYLLNSQRVGGYVNQTLKFKSRRSLCEWVAKKITVAGLWKQEVVITDFYTFESITIGGVEYSLSEQMAFKGGLVTWMKNHLRSELL